MASKKQTVDPNDPWGVLGTSPATTVTGNKPFVGPTLDPQVIQERAKLKSQEVQALQKGIDPATVTSIASGKGDPNRGFLGPARWLGNVIKNVYDVDLVPGKGSFQPLVKAANLDIIPGSKEFKPVKATGKAAATVGTRALVAASPAIDKLDFGRRLITSTLKEVGDEVRVWRGNADRGKEMQGTSNYAKFQGKGGFSASDWWNQLSKEGGIDGGDFFANIKNPYLNQLLGFAADVFLDPTTYVTGPGGIGKTAVSRGIITGATSKGANVAARAAVAQADQFAAALARKGFEDALDDAIRIGDNTAAKAAEQAIVKADKQAAAAAKKLAGDAAGRTMGRTSNQALAERVLNMRDEAQKVVDIGTETIPGQIAYAQRTVEVLNDAVIANIQKSGLAGIAGPFVDIIKGVRTPAQDILGVRGGLRFPNPKAAAQNIGTSLKKRIAPSADPFNLFPDSPLKVVIPGTERITNVAGKLLAESRLGLFKGPIGPLTAKVLNNITPTGEGGILGSADLLELRTGLRRGGLSPQEAQEATRLLQLDQQYRALVNNERKVAGGYLQNSRIAKDFTPAQLNEVIRLRQAAKGAGVPVALTPEQQLAANAIDKIFDDLYNYSAKASGGTGYIPPRRADYFPQMQSDESLRWAARFPKKAEELAKKLNVDRTWFVGNFRARELKAGDEFFGKVLDQTDIDGGAEALNTIARKWGLDFDYFETDALKVIGKYTQKHAQFAALQKTIGALPEQFPTMAARVRNGDFVTPKVIPGRTGSVGLSLGIGTIPTEEMLTALSKGELQSILDDLQLMSSKMNLRSIDAKELSLADNVLEQRLYDIAADFKSGALTPPAAAVVSDEVIKLAQLIINDVKGKFFEPKSVPITRWTEYSKIVKKGFQELNPNYFDVDGNLIKGTAPDIAVTDELADLLRNAERMEDPAFAARARQLTKDYTNFSKAYLVARPGFHVRNALSNVFQLVAAGANPRYLNEGRKLLIQVNDGLKLGKTPRQIAEAIIRPDIITLSGMDGLKAKRVLIDAIEDSINYSGATGFGQFGEIAAEVGTANRGLLQKGAPKGLKGVRDFDRGLTKQISRGAGGLLVANRKAGEFIENYTRFGLMWDGISKGLSPAEATARVNKYLIDYSDLSNLDKVAKQIIPFWTFMSRNTPLQIELMWTNPRAYALYNSAQRQIEDKTPEEEGGLVIPGYEKDRGVFATKEEGFGKLLPGNVIRPGLSFPGGGDNVIKGFIENPKGFLANTNPVFRAPLEAAFGVKLFTGAPIAKKGEKTKDTAERMKYLGRELFSPTSPIAALLKGIPGVNQSKFVEEYFGINPDDAEPMVQTVNSILSYFGAPFGTQRTESSVNELKNRYYDLEAYIRDAQDKAKIKQEERIKDNQTNVSNQDDPWGVLGP
jgi:hypothetical protein